MANRPKVLLCDEATSALDPKTTDAILDLLVDINRQLGLTIALITHDMHVIRKICHRVAVMEAGRIVEKGDVLEVFRHPKQPVTKDFIKQVTESELAEETIQRLTEQFTEGTIVKLTFIGESTQQSFVTELFRRSKARLNILEGRISQTPGGAYGTLFIQMEGDTVEIERTLAFCRERNVESEVISNAESMVPECGLG